MNTQQFRYDPYSPEAMRDPQSLYTVLREQHPAYFIPEYDTWVFSRYEDVWNGFQDSEHFSEAEMQLFSREQLLEHHRGNPPPPKINPVKDMFLFLDTPVHSAFRRAMGAPFLKNSVDKLAPEITRMTRERLAELLPKGRFDLNGDLASPVSISATALVMGIEVKDTAEIAELVSCMVAREPGQPGQISAGIQAREKLFDFLLEAIDKRRRGTGPESRVIDPLLNKDLIGRPLTDEEIATDISAILLIASANRDEQEFKDAGQFIWNRKAKRMLSFGVGPHFCIGIHLARLEMQILLREFLHAVADYTVHPEQGIWPETEFQIGWLKLPVTINQVTK